MDIKRSCALSPLINTNRSILSTPENRPPARFPFDSNAGNISPFDFTPKKDEILDEQIRLERDIANQSSIKTQDSFKTTYSSLQTILSQMQVKLASAFLQETEYLKHREQQLELDEQLVKKRLEKLKILQKQREELEKEFSKIKDQLETAVRHVLKFQTDGVRDLFYIYTNKYIQFIFRNKSYEHYFLNLVKSTQIYLDLYHNL